MTTEIEGTQGLLGPDEFDLLLDEVLRTVANPEIPERVRVQVRTRVWVREMALPERRSSGSRGGVVFPAAVFVDFQARMNPKRSTASTLWALAAHAAAIALIFWMAAVKMPFAAREKDSMVTELTPPPPMAAARATAMGGGGGQRGATPVSKGELPKFADRQITAPKAPPMVEPKIRMPDATIEVQRDLKMANSAMPNLGMPDSPLSGGSMGNGRGSGIGAGNGSGFGPGWGGNYGGGVRQIGGGVSSPELIYKVEPEFSEEARKAKTAGNVLVSMVVDAKGMPQNVHVISGVGMGLDEKAVEAVRQYRFRPAMEGGKAIAVYLNVDVNFQIF